MNNRRRNMLFLSVLVVFLTGAVYCIKSDEPVVIEKYITVQRFPNIKPDYTGTVIPPNIAPLNFIVEESGSHYYVKIHSKNGEDIEIFSKTPKIIIPIGSWKKLLRTNRSEKLYFDIYVKETNDDWKQFNTITNLIADADIDGYLVYRLINPLYSFWRNISIRQRNIQNYDESVIISNKSINGGCVNCHTFLKNSPDNMLMHIRSSLGPTMLIARNGVITNINSRTSFGTAAMAYSSWHPSGRLMAFSVNKVHQFFHTVGQKIRDVIDTDSAVGIYSLDSNTIITPASLSKPDLLETYPSWSPDGRYLYFCSAPITWSDRDKFPPEDYKEIRYDLMRISYEPETGTWGEPETILSAEETGLSITQPKVSPDGRFILFCMAEYGCFPIYQPSSDLYMMNLKNGQYKRLMINSDKCDSWHCWSSSGRWIVFSSKRLAYSFAKPYFSYINMNGEPSKPILLPQKDPTFYDSFLKTYNVPEFITQPVQVKRRVFEMAIRSPQNIIGIDPVTSATSPSSSSPEPYQQENR